jgi:hypothetical protein
LDLVFECNNYEVLGAYVFLQRAQMINSKNFYCYEQEMNEYLNASKNFKATRYFEDSVNFFILSFLCE